MHVVLDYPPRAKKHAIENLIAKDVRVVLRTFGLEACRVGVAVNYIGVLPHGHNVNMGKLLLFVDYPCRQARAYNFAFCIVLGL